MSSIDIVRSDKYRTGIITIVRVRIATSVQTQYYVKVRFGYHTRILRP